MKVVQTDSVIITFKRDGVNEFSLLLLIMLPSNAPVTDSGVQKYFSLDAQQVKIGFKCNQPLSAPTFSSCQSGRSVAFPC